MVGFNMKYNQAKWFDYTCQWCVKVWGNHLFMLYFLQVVSGNLKANVSCYTGFSKYIMWPSLFGSLVHSSPTSIRVPRPFDFLVSWLPSRFDLGLIYSLIWFSSSSSIFPIFSSTFSSSFTSSPPLLPPLLLLHLLLLLLTYCQDLLFLYFSMC